MIILLSLYLKIIKKNIKNIISLWCTNVESFSYEVGPWHPDYPFRHSTTYPDHLRYLMTSPLTLRDYLRLYSLYILTLCLIWRFPFCIGWTSLIWPWKSCYSLRLTKWDAFLRCLSLIYSCLLFYSAVSPYIIPNFSRFLSHGPSHRFLSSIF